MTVRVFDDEDLAALKRVLESGDLSAIGGQAGREFEAAFAAEMGVKSAYAVNSGMSALHAAVFASGAGAGDEVICDSMVQFGSAAVMYHNAVPVFADVRRDTHCIDPESVRERITERTKAIICTHLWGLPADMDPIMEIADEHGLVVIEDNAHGLYATYKGRLTGTLGHMAEFSFQMSKQLGLGDAGMVTTMDARFEDNLWDAAGHRQLSTFPRLVWNYRLNELVSAVGIVQLKRSRGYVESGIANAEIYNQLAAEVGWIGRQHVPEDRTNSYHIWGGTFEGDQCGVPYDRFKAAVEEAGVNVMVGYIQTAPYLYPMYQEPLTYGRGCPIACPLQARQVEYKPGLCPVAEDLMPRILLIGTVGSREVHRENAEKLHDVARQFD